MLTDPIADMLTRIRNACTIRQAQVVIPSSNVKQGIARILVDEGFVENFYVTDEEPQPNIVMKLKYTGKGDPVISGLDRVSRPGRRVYLGYRDLDWVRSGLGVNILSTPQGLVTGRTARRNKVGGEVLCKVW